MRLVVNGQDGMDSNLKTSGEFFQVCALVSLFFQNSFDFVSLVAWKQFMHEQGSSI